MSRHLNPQAAPRALATLTLAAVLAVLTGCATTAVPTEPSGPRDASWQAPLPAGVAASGAALSSISVNASDKTAATVADANAPLDWQAVIRDERLRQLVTLALDQNRDLRVALRNIDAARASVRTASAARLPTLNATAGASATRTAADLSGTGRGVQSQQVSAGLGVSAWELDLWGRLARLDEAAQAALLASEATARSVRASLVAEVATAWLTLAADQQLLALQQQTLDSQQATLALAEKRVALGQISSLDLATVQAATQTARAAVAASRTQLAQDGNALRLLLGTEPPAALLPGAGLQAQQNVDASTALLALPDQLPASVLRRRADVQAAERTLQADDARLAAAQAARWPTLSLSASLGLASTAVTGLLGAGNGVFALTPSLTAPLFDGGSREAAVDSARATRAAQLATYEKTLQTAFKEVADALATRSLIDERLAAQQAQADAYARTVTLTETRQRLGADSSLAVLEAQRSAWAARESLVSLRLAEQTNRLTLFKALGGS